MKTTKLSLFALITLLSLSFILTSCSKNDEPQGPSKSSDLAVAIPYFVRNSDGQLPSQPTDLLYEARKNYPLLAPDGHQLTWGEFNTTKGSVDVQCTNDGYRTNVTLSGLVPNGVYTIWSITVKAPGFDPAAEMFNITGIGATGDGVGTDNYFTASADGRAEISMDSPGGALSMFGNIATCPVADEFEFHIVGAYHIDGKTYGPNLGPDGTVVEQFGFIFQNAD